MESLLFSYELPFEEFRKIIMSTNSIIAGSSALSLYMKQEGIEINYTPHDIDIFIGLSYDYKDELTAFLTYYGYKIVKNTNVSTYYNDIDILDIVSFENHTHKKIQLIHVNTSYLFEYIAQNFDISACVTWWNPLKNYFSTLHPVQTLQKQMFVSNTLLQHEYAFNTLKNHARINKYLSRGFTLHDPPTTPYMLLKNDLRYALFQENPLENLSAFDIWAYEDVSCTTFLLNSMYHIIIKVGEQLYAFHRLNLHKYMTEHYNYIPNLGYVYKTPHNQSVTINAMNCILYSDYSIYELHSAYTVSPANSNNTEISLYTMKCYSIQHWINNTPTAIETIDSTVVGVDIYADEEEMPPLISDDEDMFFGSHALYNDPMYYDWVDAIEDVHEQEQEQEQEQSSQSSSQSSQSPE